MRCLSSSSTFLYKLVFPPSLLGMFVVIFVVPGFVSGWLAAFLFLVIAAVMKWYGLDLVDEVWDNGTEIIVRNWGKESRIPLVEIASADVDLSARPSRVILELARGSRYGKSVKFVPRAKGPFTDSPNEDVTALIERIAGRS